MSDSSHPGPATQQPAPGEVNIQDFKGTLFTAIAIMVLVIVGVWLSQIWANANIVFVEPLSISLFTTDCEAEAERCYNIGNPVQSGNEPHPVSVINLVKYITTGLAFLITVYSYINNPFETEENTILLRLLGWASNLLVGTALALFAWTVFSSIEVLAGLGAIDDSPQIMKFSIALLTVAVFVSVFAFLLIEWIRDLDIVDIGRAGILILIVSYSLSIPLASHSWNNAYSALGNSNSSALIAGGNGSEKLFMFTMFGLAAIFVAFAINIIRLFHDLFSEGREKTKAGNNRAQFLIAASGIAAGIGSIIVGYFPTNTSPGIHQFGAILAVSASFVLVALLIYVYPESGNNEASRGNLLQTMGLIIILGIAVIAFVKVVSQDFSISLLEWEFSYFFFFLLFIQVYSSHLKEYIKDDASMPDLKDYRELRNYPISGNTLNMLRNPQQKGGS